MSTERDTLETKSAEADERRVAGKDTPPQGSPAPLALVREDSGKTRVTTPPNPDPIPAADEDGAFDLDSPDCYLNRELTWLNFNFRILQEATDPRTPPLEQLKFISIVASNLDEFFMKRIGGLKQQMGAGVLDLTVDGRTPEEQIDACYALVADLEALQGRALRSVLDTLEEHGLVITSWDHLDKEERKRLREAYLERIYPLVTPQALDPAHPFPFVSNLSLNLFVGLQEPGQHYPAVARVKVPLGAGIKRFVQLGDSLRFIPIESVIANNLDILFPGMEVTSCALFRVTRNSNTEVSEENADDLLERIETGLRQRRFAPIVRVEVSPGMDPSFRGKVAAELGLDEQRDVFAGGELMQLADLMELATLEVTNLRDSAHHPVDHPNLISDRSIFYTIREEGPILLHHPYHSYSRSVERLLEEAANDPKVRAIKVTFYRTSAESRAIDLLIDAAQNGKQVTAVMEIKASFDERANIAWANRLGAAGIHVTYGVVGLKTHCKAILIVRDDYDGIRRYAHISTGNYNADTARLYADIGLLTCDPRIGADLTELFNYLTTGFKPKRKYSKLQPAPKGLERYLLSRIEAAARAHSPDSPSRIQFKMNALEDPGVTKALYRASQAGVGIDLVIRDSCRLRPGIPGLSENVRVLSILGRFLEHARVYYFDLDGVEEYYIASADCMSRNLRHRVEILTPIEDPALREELRYFFDLQLRETRGGWEMQADGSYVKRVPDDASPADGCQEEMIRWAQEGLREATRLKRRKTQGTARRRWKS